MKRLTKLFAKKNKQTIYWKGTISSDGSNIQGPVHVLSLRTEEDKNEFEEGWKDGKKAFDNKEALPQTLNYPFHPYARGFVEAYRGLQNRNI